ncbi:MAG: GC-type dockerin domain-anchored protein [Planctomycetota bacterium]
MKIPKTSVFIGALLVTMSSQAASAQLLDVQIDVPTDDRWQYPFNAAPGLRASAPTFAAILVPGFDDRDAEFTIAFDTTNDVTPGLAPSAYRTLRLTLTATIENEEQFRYDPSYDPFTTYLDIDTDPEATVDADTGRPIELFATGFFGGGLNSLNWVETSAFGGPPTVPPAQGSRFVRAVGLNPDGTVGADFSNQIKDRFDVTPLAIGTTGDVAIGELVPALTEFTFDIDLCSSGHAAYFAQALSEGRIILTLSSLHPAAGGASGGIGDPTYPIFLTKDNPLAFLLDASPRLDMQVQVGSSANYDGMGGVDFFDVLAFLSDFDARAPRADLNGDCVFDFFDVLAYLGEFDAG